MDKSHKIFLLKNRLEFVKDLEPNDVTGFLYQEHVISENDKDVIDNLKTRRDRVEFLMDLLPRKGPKVLPKFYNILNMLPSYKHLAQLIAKQVNFESANLDIIDGKQEEVAVRPRSSSQLLSSMLDSYSMTSTSRGWCFILNNVNFSYMSSRRGSERDAENLKLLFEKLGFKIWVVNDADAASFSEKFTELAKKPDHGCCLIVCLLSHGVAGKIYGTDGELVAVSELLEILSEGTEKVKSIPKLFLIQACRVVEKLDAIDSGLSPSKKFTLPKSGMTEVVSIRSDRFVSIRSDIPFDRSQTQKTYSMDSLTSFINEHEKPLQSDILLGYSTFPGDVSWRHTKNGSYFIDSVVSVFSNYAATEDVASMMVKVNQLVKEKLAKNGEFQIPAPVITLTKKLFLFPI
ncbi:caspase-2-like [Hydra vulgaris]|uniref:CARD caspase 1 n=1 Tax=Hydra vulgaris TaxID=6087 RepID=D1MAR4_HYDVU|nr:caspase-2-like [Hydra vulgaris]ACY95435.1 CARD caspase 1 [Hydra vulgaris]